MKDEIEAFIGSAYEREKMEGWKDVYVTDHEPKTPKYFTLNKEEDMTYFKYKKSLEEYNSI